MLLTNKNLQTIWITPQNESRLPDQLMDNLLAWRKSLPEDWRLLLWTDTAKVNAAYLAHLQEQNILVLNVHDVISKLPNWLQKILKQLQQPSQFTALSRMFSDVFRMVLMAIEGHDFFGGIYVDATDTNFPDAKFKELSKVDLPHGFAFTFRDSFPVYFDSNVTAFAPYSRLPDAAKTVLKLYFARLAEISIEDINFCVSHGGSRPGNRFLTYSTNTIALFNIFCNYQVCLADNRIQFAVNTITAQNLVGALPKDNSLQQKLTYTKVYPDVHYITDTSLLSGNYQIHTEFGKEHSNALKKNEYLSFGDFLYFRSQNPPKGMGIPIFMHEITKCQNHIKKSYEGNDSPLEASCLADLCKLTREFAITEKEKKEPAATATKTKPSENQSGSWLKSGFWMETEKKEAKNLKDNSSKKAAPSPQPSSAKKNIITVQTPRAGEGAYSVTAATSVVVTC